jgi:hypothetical protein
MSVNSWIEDFTNPPATFRPIPFWSWNENTNPDEVRQQVDQIAEAGWGGFMIHSRVGLITPYLSEDWFKNVQVAIEQAQKRGINVWIYDEDRWPSGYGGGRVVEKHPEYRQEALTARPVGTPVPENCQPLGEPSHDLQLYVWQSPMGHEFFNGTCYTSTMNRSGMRKFLDIAYEPYYARFKEEYGRTILGHFTDEPATLFRYKIVHGAIPYSRDVRETFQRLFGYDPQPEMIKLFLNLDGSVRFRLHYYRTINHLFETHFTVQLGEWCREHGALFTGHYVMEGGLYEQQLWGVHIMPNYRHMDIPGIDHLCLQIDEKVTAIQCRSVVNQYGKKRMLSELYGASGQNLTFEDRKWIAEQQICLGVNLLNLHLSSYTMAGCRKRDFPPNLFYQQPWWPVNRMVDDYLSRLCAIMSRGKYIPEIVILHPQESIAALWTPKLSPGLFNQMIERDNDPVAETQKQEIDRLNHCFKRITDLLLGLQRTFDYADEVILEESGKVVFDKNYPELCIGQMKYPWVIIPPMLTMRPKTLDLLLEFGQNGGTILSIGKLPDLIDGHPSPRLELLASYVKTLDDPEQLPSIHKKISSPDIEIISANPQAQESLWIHRRQIQDQELLFIVNLSRRYHQDVTLKWRNTAGSAILCLDPRDGSQHPFPSRVDHSDHLLDLSFAPGQSYLLITEQLKNVAPLAINRSFNTNISSPSAWEVERLDDNALILDHASYQLKYNERFEDPVPIIALQEYLNGSSYNGPLSVRFTFENQIKNLKGIRLVSEYSERWKITVNGQQVRYEGLPYWLDIRWKPIDITNQVIPGRNIIELTCENFQCGDLRVVHDPYLRYGTEIEAIYLVGDFGVQGHVVSEQPISPEWDRNKLNLPAIRSFTGPFTLLDSLPLTRGDVTIQGLPFYAGRLHYSLTDTAIKASSIHLTELHAVVAEISGANRILGHIAWAPYRLSMPDQVQNISITLYNSLGNLLGPHHHPSGLTTFSGPGSFTGDPWNVRTPKGKDQSWMVKLRTHPSEVLWCNRYLVRQYGLFEIPRLGR